uniref:Zinc finger CCCH domain-containing protein 14 n=1 Tax=Oryzias melastigma TaxID=30732 RepID=A0A3B3CGH1_ORYME
MEIGAEISKKIRAAIKGKLQELGAYIDEELPDYIMVMVANKKTPQQMTDDLSLFLGNNTVKFTAWYVQNPQSTSFRLHFPECTFTGSERSFSIKRAIRVDFSQETTQLEPRSLTSRIRKIGRRFVFMLML